MFEMSSPVIHIILRAVLIYLGLWIFFRASGKRQLGEMSPFDLILLLIISESVSNSLSAGEESIQGGLLSALTLIAMGFAVDYLSYRSKRFEKVVDGEPKVIIQHGVVDEKIRIHEKISHDELNEAVRHKGYASTKDVDLAILETNGKISTISFSH